MNTKESLLPRVTMSEIGLYLRTIYLDYTPKDNQETADLITHNFNVLCLVEDIEHYEELHSTLAEMQDYELVSRRVNYFRELGEDNPFY